MNKRVEVLTDSPAGAMTASREGRLFTLTIPFASDVGADEMIDCVKDMAERGQIALVITTTPSATHEAPRTLQ